MSLNKVKNISLLLNAESFSSVPLRFKIVRMKLLARCV
jgi:hypothetical protein